MRLQRLPGWAVLLLFAVGTLHRPQPVQAAPAPQVSAFDLIIAMNTLRVSYGLPALIEDPIVNAVAQSTAATMAANNMSWHIGDVRGRIASAGYGGGATVWATENFAVGTSMGIDEIMAAWADPDHMRPAVNPAYCHVGAGTAQASNGRIYYILQAAYVAGQECGSVSSAPPAGGTAQPGAVPNSVPGVSQLIVPVKIATPDGEGKIFHDVRAGQSYWSIAIAYQITIRDLEVWNNTSRTIPLQSGQRLFIPGKDTAGYATPTPFGMIVPAAPDKDGKIVHEVGSHQTLTTIGEAYHVNVSRILTLNGWQEDWPLQIGQKLVIDPGHVTPSPTLSNIQKLTPESDGNYYHTVQSGETLSWIASLYEVSLSDLMSWNGLNSTSVIRPDQKLRLLVTPPATETPTPGPPTATPSPSATGTQALPTATTSLTPTEPRRGTNLPLILGVSIMVVGGGLLWWRFARKDQESQ